MSGLLESLRAAQLIGPLDEHLARTLVALAGERDERVLLAAALVSRQVSSGHVCLPVPELARGEISLGEDFGGHAPSWPEAQAWLRVLRASPLCGAAGEGETPLVLDAAGRLYLRRYFEHERALAAEIRQRVRSVVGAPPRERLEHYFGSDPEDRQRMAAERALSRTFCVVAGGPGTGKTSTVVKIVALAIESTLAQGLPAPRVALMAPTGKAAVRLEGAVRSAKLRLDAPPEVLEAIPESASTIHRALGSRGRGRRKLRLDWLFVDEASMVDLELMSELFSALPDEARVVLLGDQHQLASVEAGAVLGDICGLGGASADADADELSRSVIQLTRSYRFEAHSGIDRLARAIQAGDAPAALAVLADPAYPDVSLCAPAAGRGMSRELAASIVAGYRPYLEAVSDPARALALFERFRVVCAHRRGDQGVETMNRAIVRLLYERELIERPDGNFLGRPLLVTQNDYRNRLWNGDLGLVGESPARDRVVSFLSPDGQTRQLGFGRLPPHETAFALSVHKSQGSEVDEVCLVLPDEPSPILTRELLYTAVTRARQRVVIHGSSDLIAHAITRHVARFTGLRDQLYAP